jgi:hypothetical protein
MVLGIVNIKGTCYNLQKSKIDGYFLSAPLIKELCLIQNAGMPEDLHNKFPMT